MRRAKRLDVEIVSELRYDLEGGMSLSVLIEVLVGHYHLSSLFRSEIRLDVVL